MTSKISSVHNSTDRLLGENINYSLDYEYDEQYAHRAKRIGNRYYAYDGNIYEWDYQHGDVEKYDKRGKHKGSIDPKTGEQTKPPVKGREVEP